MGASRQLEGGGVCDVQGQDEQGVHMQVQGDEGQHMQVQGGEGQRDAHDEGQVGHGLHEGLRGGCCGLQGRLRVRVRCEQSDWAGRLKIDFFLVYLKLFIWYANCRFDLLNGH